jgi:hypothetical protein
MLGCATSPRNHYCTACFSGNYPVSDKRVAKNKIKKEPVNKNKITV